MLLSVVVVNWNSREDLRACLSSLRAQTHRELELIVVDNGSTDGSADMVAAEFPEARLLRQSENLGFAEACNRGIDLSRGAWVAMLNNDTVADRDWALELVKAAETAEPDCGMLQSLLLFQDRPDTINSTGIELTRSGGGRDRDAGSPRASRTEPDEIFCPTAGAAAYRRTMLDAVRLPEGYFDREYFMYCEDMDLGWRARLGAWSARYVPSSFVHHKWTGSSKRLGRSWLIVISHTNRIRTLLKNASLPLLLRTSLPMAADVVALAWHGRFLGLSGLARAVGQSLARRSDVAKIATVDRRVVERAWIAKPS
jgi:GT2 family glycosyltransferase